VQQRKSEGELQRAIANRVRAKSEYERLLRIQNTDRDAVAETQVVRGKENYQLAEADIAAFQASVDAATDAVSYSRLKAPFDGIVASTFVENFESVQAQQPIVRLLDSSRVEFEFHVPETMISLVPQVRNLRVRFDAFSDLQIPAQIKEIGSEASATTRTYPVTLIMEQPEGAEILAGMSGKVSGEVRSAGAAGVAAIIVPMSSVFSPASDDKSFVWVIDEASNTVSRRQVTIGDVGAAGLNVKEGLQVGELIATAGVHFLTEGQQVRPQQK
jgi:RND family efflux transporter MFP subunit